MHIAVCVKYVPNPEAAFSMFSIDPAGLRVVPVAGLPWVMSPFDEQALEAALRLRDGHGEMRITVITLGTEAARNALKHGLAMGADDGVLLADPAFDDGDGFATARALARAIGQLGAVDLVLTGRQAADDDAGVVGAALGELLGLPVVSFASRVELAADRGSASVTRVLDDGSELIEVSLPAVVTVSNELGAPRVPNLRETMRAARKPVVVLSAAALGFAPSEVGAAAARCVREQVFLPEARQCCERIDDGSPQAMAEALLLRLREVSAL